MRPVNLVPVGTETLCRHKQLGDKKLIMVEVAEPNIWQPKYLLVWETAHGSLPPEHRIKFIEGDFNNVALGKLICVLRIAPIGSESAQRFGRSKYIMVKVAEPNIWKPKHYLVWEAAHGPMSREYTLRFIDGSPKNVALDNLVLLPFVEYFYMRKNLPSGLTGEMFEAGICLAKVAVTNKKLNKAYQAKLKAIGGQGNDCNNGVAFLCKATIGFYPPPKEVKYLNHKTNPGSAGFVL